MHRFRFALPLVLFGLFSAFSAHAGQREFAIDFINAHDNLTRSRNEVRQGRVDMALNLDNKEKLEDLVREWFNDRADVEKFAVEKSEKRDAMFDETIVTLDPVVRPTKPTKVLQTDAQAFITAYDQFVNFNQEVQLRIDSIRNALAQPDNVILNNACAEYFQFRRKRRIARDQWVSSLKAMKTDLKFKATAKPVKFDANSLRDYTQEYLNDRNQWEALGQQIEVALNNLRAAVNAPDSLPAVVTTLLTDKRARLVKAQELQKDRQGMARNNGLKSVKSVLKGLFVNNKDGNVDEEEDDLEQSRDHVGI